MEIVKVTNLKKTYNTGEVEVLALKKIDLSIQEGEFVSIIGTSGSGKSTLLKIMGGLVLPTEGEVIVRNMRLNTMSDDELTIFRRRNIGFIFQNFNLLDMLNVYENILFPIRLDQQIVDSEFFEKIVKELGLKINYF